MDEVKLSLVGIENEANDEPEVYSFERRRETRTSVSGRATLFKIEQPKDVYQYPITHVELLDQSRSGLSVKSNRAYETGERIRVFFTPHGVDAMDEREGIVVWCKKAGHQRGGGYEMAICFGNRAAA